MKVIFLFLFVAFCAHAQQTVGVFKHDPSLSYNGYTLFAPITSKTTYLIDNDGQVVKQWRSQYGPGQAVMLLNDGTLLRTGAPAVQSMGGGGAGGLVEKFDWDGKLLWLFEHYGSTYRLHHDVEILPNGNILLLVWESHTREEAIAQGRIESRLTENELWSERIIEVRQTGPATGEIVWSWSSWDHMCQSIDPSKPNYSPGQNSPDRIDINVGGTRSDWLHMNSVRYNAKRDEVLVSIHNLNELWIISRTSGDIVYRWGNPMLYQRGTMADQKLFAQHDARWLDSNGTRITMFNNGSNRPNSTPTNYSTVEEIVVPLDASGNYLRQPNAAFGPATSVWKYPEIGTTQFYATNISGATRMPNGNTLACLGPQGILTEVTADGKEVWRYVSPVGNMGPILQGQTPRNTMIFKVYRFGPDHPALAGKTLTKQGRLEDGPLDVNDAIPSPTSVQLDVLSRNVYVSVLVSGNIDVDAYDVSGRWLGKVVNEELSVGKHTRHAPHGTYLVVLREAR